MSSSSEGEMDTLSDDLKNSFYLKALAEFAKSGEQPRIQLLIAHGLVELIVNKLIEVKCKNGSKISSDNRGFPHSTKCILLHELELIDDLGFKLLNRLRKLRNDAAHRPLFNLDVDQFRGEISKLYSDYGYVERIQPGKHFSGICIAIISHIWNPHAKILSPLFLADNVK